MQVSPGRARQHQLKVYHALLSGPGTRYAGLGPDYYERQASTRRQIAHHVGKLGALGFEVTLCRIPEPGPGQEATTPAASPTAAAATGRPPLPAAAAVPAARPGSL